MSFWRRRITNHWRRRRERRDARVATLTERILGTLGQAAASGSATP